MNCGPPGDRPEWLSREAARAIARAAHAALARRDSPEEARAAVRAAAAACLPSLPASMLAEVAAAVAPSDPQPPELALPSVAPADAGKLARRIAALTGGANLPPSTAADRLAARLASAGAARIGADDRAGEPRDTDARRVP